MVNVRSKKRLTWFTNFICLLHTLDGFVTDFVITPTSIDDRQRQLKNIHHQLFMQYSYTFSSLEDVVIDIDRSGHVGNSKTYGLIDKGYFTRKRGKGGY